ncbi:MAG: TIGR03790 family protein, partial [Pseudomonadota bacterium]|nr:TIGR03790 family protein [Pseudomonadota bacterium]
ALALALAALGPLVRAAPSAEPLARLSLPSVGLRARDLAVVVNDADPASVEIGRYYAAQRGIATEHVVHVRFAPGQAVMTFADFERVRAVLDAKVGADVQAYALAWTLPFRVECMSVTAAFAFGFDPASYCAEGCQTTKASPYFNSTGRAPFTEHRLRPAMLLAGSDVESAKRLIDRGVRSDERWPEGKAYLMNTSDGGRNLRAESYERVRAALGAAYPIEQVDADALEGRSDVMFEFTGVANVASMASNSFLDGAIADHLTSFGGALSGGGQTTALEWLTAGATGSYGTSSEPCNYRAKFPEVGLVMAHYLSGETLIEAYWKSVLMPGQGVFVGDPLARPFGGIRVTRSAAGTTIATRALPPGNYLLEAARSPMGPFQTIRVLRIIGFGIRQLTLPAGDTHYFRLRSVAEPASAASS